MLSCIAAPRNEFEIALATLVSGLTAAGGWCGLGTAGRLTVSIEQRSLPNLRILLDGREISSLKPRQRKGARDLGLPELAKRYTLRGPARAAADR